MTTSRTTGQGSSGRDDNALAPVTYLPGVRENAGRESNVREGSDGERSDRENSGREGDARRAENVTLHAITRRGQSRAEVAELLRRREIAPDVAEAELDRLESVGLIDDSALALDMVDRLRSRKKLGTSALRNELMRRKIDRAAIDEALSDPDNEAEGDMLQQLAADRARRLGSLDRTTAERRLVDFLARKGHTGSAARDAARRALDGGGHEYDSSHDGAGHGSARIHRVEFR